jgi:hypothetical protein
MRRDRCQARSSPSTTALAEGSWCPPFQTPPRSSSPCQPTFEDSVDGVTLIQEYIQAPEPYITRVEFVGGRFLYAVRVDTSLGFELCPADVCQVGDAFCPVGEDANAGGSVPAAVAPRFRIIEDFRHPIVARYRKFIADHGIGIAGIEFIIDRAGEIYTYDVNTNTNYNSDAEAAAGIYGMRAIAAYLGSERRPAHRRRVERAGRRLSRLQRRRPRAAPSTLE